MNFTVDLAMLRNLASRGGYVNLTSEQIIEIADDLEAIHKMILENPWEKRAGDLWDALQEISKITDVMIGNGPGAVDVYYTRGKGLPTMYRHLVDHAKEIRKVIARVGA